MPAASTVSTPRSAGGRHGKGSDEEQQGKEEAEGRAQQEQEEGRPGAVTVRGGARPGAARREPLRQEGVADRRLEDCQHVDVDAAGTPARMGPAGGWLAKVIVPVGTVMER